MLFCILLLTTTPSFSDFCAITRSSSAGARSSRARGPGERSASCRAPRARPSISESACGTADPSSRARASTVRLLPASAVPPPSLHLLLRKARGKSGSDRDLRRGELHRLARVLLRNPFHLEEDLS